MHFQKPSSHPSVFDRLRAIKPQRRNFTRNHKKRNPNNWDISINFDSTDTSTIKDIKQDYMDFVQRKNDLLEKDQTFSEEYNDFNMMCQAIVQKEQNRIKHEKNLKSELDVIRQKARLKEEILNIRKLAATMVQAHYRGRDFSLNVDRVYC
jgi:hypothetical protein